MYSSVSLENIFADLHCPVDQLHQGHDAHPGEEAEGAACNDNQTSDEIYENKLKISFFQLSYVHYPGIKLLRVETEGWSYVFSALKWTSSKRSASPNFGAWFCLF